jgi:hypothetical protein
MIIEVDNEIHRLPNMIDQLDVLVAEEDGNMCAGLLGDRRLQTRYQASLLVEREEVRIDRQNAGLVATPPGQLHVNDLA